MNRLTHLADLPIVFSAEVEAARVAGGAIVALESTIITHGMPYPQNVETAHAVEATIRDEGATPATIAVIDGVIHIGLEADELDQLGQAKNVMKLSRADLAVCIALKRTGATTVAGTMICAALAGIKVFATGGIGGVHRGAANSFDVSADLREFAHSNVTVVCAGAKAILDLPKTLEVLETYGVPVMAYGQDGFPAFWARESGLAAPMRVDNVNDIVACANMRSQLGLSGGLLVANPIPKKDEIKLTQISQAIGQALAQVEAEEISAKNVTPYVLDKIYTLTKGQSLKANIALVLNNARLASKIALEFARPAVK